MDTVQIAQEIRDLRDELERQQTATDTLIQNVQLIEERLIPASVADLAHQLSGVQTILVGLAGTTASLGAQLLHLTDRVDLLERSLIP